jgi:16S rRNA (cytosine1402-N4)-methyltransferase
MQSHISVLTDESVEALQFTESSIVVDATIGAGGHARAITEKLGKTGTFIGIDADEDAINAIYEEFAEKKCKTYLQVGNFKNINSILEQYKIPEVDGILADLGWRMEQFSGNGRGFSFMVDEPLIMTFGNPSNYPFIARDVVNDWKLEDLRNIFKAYGEEKFAHRIAKEIVESREKEPIETTFDLVEIIKQATPTRYHHGHIHPATRVFQALRITVNDEFETLEIFIQKSIGLLKTQGRLAIISFHSLEDRIVKHTFKNLAQNEIGTIVTKKPITATIEEIQKNPRARSAKLRIFQKNNEKTSTN